MAMKLWQYHGQKIIEVDGQRYYAKFIGKGNYSKVYRVGDRVVYYTRGDCGKEVLAMFMLHRMMHLPEMIRHENITTATKRWYVFSSPYYRNVTKKDVSAWRMMKQLIKVVHEEMRRLVHQGFRYDYYMMEAIVDSLEDQSLVRHSIILALREIVYVASNCGSKVGFDFKPNNFGVNEYGVLIFRDPIYVRN